jgi:branched-chain amino acid transport system substrate-binding protein
MKRYVQYKNWFVWISLLFTPLLRPTSSLGADYPLVKIGIIVAQSGKAQNYGHSAIQGAQLAVDEINALGGVLHHLLKLTIFDNKSTAIYSKVAAAKAVDHNVVGVVGAVWSTHSLAAAPVLQKHRIPMISPGSTAPEVTQVGHYIFRTCYTDAFQGKLMADFAYKSAHHKRAAVLTNISESYSKILGHYFSANFILNGGDVVFEGGYMGSAADYKDILLPLKSLKPHVIFVPGYSQDSGLIIKQARNMGIDSVFMGGDAWEMSIADYAGTALNGSFFSTFWHPNAPYQRNRQFMNLFKASYGSDEISAYVPLAYDAVWLLADAMRRANSLDPQKIRDALAATQKYRGATGRFSFNASGDPINKGASILKYKNNHWFFFKYFQPNE